MKQKAPVAKEQHAHPTNGGPSHDKVAERAYEFFLARGGTDGQDVEDWLRAEAELRAAES
jgi:hypothetical protein